MTNVAFTPEYIQKIKKIIECNRPLIDCEVWNFESLNTLLRSNENILIQYFPYLGLNIEKLKMKLTKNKNITNKYLDKFKDIFVDFELKKKYYYAFVYLLSPWYLDDRAKKEREKIYKLFEIKKSDEDKIIKELEKEKYIRVEIGMVIINDKNKAENILNEVINKVDISLENVVKLFL